MFLSFFVGQVSSRDLSEEPQQARHKPNAAHELLIQAGLY